LHYVRYWFHKGYIRMYSRPTWFVGRVLFGLLKLNFKLFALFANYICFAVFLSFQANASEDNNDLSKVRVTYAGFAMVGRAVDVEKSYPYSAKIEKEIQKAVSNAASKEDISELRVDLKKAGLKLIKSKALQSVPIPRKDSKSERREMDIRDVLVLLCATPSDRPSKQIEILCLRELWPVKDGYRSIYKNFIKRFGERLLRLLATRTLDEIGVLVVDEGLTEGEISAAVHLMSIEAVCISSLDNGEFLAALNNEDEIIYRLKDSDEEH